MGIVSYIIFVALCAASISYTICYTSIFRAFREWISEFHEKLEELVHCPYCFCHYVILVIMLLTNDLSNKLIPVFKWGIFNFLFTWFTIVCITSLLHCIMLIAYKPVIDYVTHRKLEKLQRKQQH